MLLSRRMNSSVSRQVTFGIGRVADDERKLRDDVEVAHAAGEVERLLRGRSCRLCSSACSVSFDADSAPQKIIFRPLCFIRCQVAVS